MFAKQTENDFSHFTSHFSLIDMLHFLNISQAKTQLFQTKKLYINTGKILRGIRIMSTYPNIYAYKFGDYYTLAAFTNGVGNAHDSDLGSQLAVGAILGGIPLAKATVWDGPKWLINNWGHYGETWKGMKDAHDTQKAAAKTFKSAYTASDKWWKSAYNWTMRSAKWQEFQGLKAKVTIPQYNTEYAEKLLKAGKFDDVIKYGKRIHKQGQVAKCYEEAAKIVERINSTTNPLEGAELRKALKELEYAGYKGQLKELEAIKNKEIITITKRGQAWNTIKTPYNWINKKLLQRMTCGIDDTGKVIAGKGDKIGAKALRTVAKGAKGGGLLTAGIEMAFETPEIIETYNKLGVAKGTKQLGKSAAVATASAVGWVVGAKVGGIAGAKIGGAIGSLFGPGVGTAIGAAIGGIIGVGCGIAGSWLCHKGMKSLMGKSELEKAKDENTLAMAKKANESDEGKKELLEAAKATADAQGGVSDQNVIDAYSRLLNEREGETVDYTQAKDGKSALVQQLEQQYQTENNSQVTNKKSALLYQLENFNTNLYQGSNPFNKQSIFS